MGRLDPVELRTQCVNTQTKVTAQRQESSRTSDKEIKCQPSAFKKPDVSYKQETPELKAAQGQSGKRVAVGHSSGGRAVALG